MALPTLVTVKNRLRIETTAGDTDLDALRAQSEALVRTFIDRPIEAVLKTYVVYPDGVRMYRALNRLFIPDYPVKIIAPNAPVITDSEATVVDATTYTVNGDTGEVRLTSGEWFTGWPYTITAEVGLTLASDYDTRIEPLISAAILDCCADFYQNRNPRAQSETVGGGVSTQWNAITDLPARTKGMLLMLRRPSA